MESSKEVESRVKGYFRRKYGFYPSDSQLKEVLCSLKFLGRAIFTTVSNKKEVSNG